MPRRAADNPGLRDFQTSIRITSAGKMELEALARLYRDSASGVIDRLIRERHAEHVKSGELPSPALPEPAKPRHRTTSR